MWDHHASTFLRSSDTNGTFQNSWGYKPKLIYTATSFNFAFTLRSLNQTPAVLITKTTILYSAEKQCGHCDTQADTNCFNSI